MKNLRLKSARAALDMSQQQLAEAVQAGLIDQVGGLSDGLQCLYRQIEQYRKTGD